MSGVHPAITLAVSSSTGTAVSHPRSVRWTASNRSASAVQSGTTQSPSRPVAWYQSWRRVVAVTSIDAERHREVQSSASSTTAVRRDAPARGRPRRAPSRCGPERTAAGSVVVSRRPLGGVVHHVPLIGASTSSPWERSPSSSSRHSLSTSACGSVVASRVGGDGPLPHGRGGSEQRLHTGSAATVAAIRPSSRREQDVLGVRPLPPPRRLRRATECHERLVERGRRGALNSASTAATTRSSEGAGRGTDEPGPKSDTRSPRDGDPVRRPEERVVVRLLPDRGEQDLPAEAPTTRSASRSSTMVTAPG